MIRDAVETNPRFVPLCSFTKKGPVMAIDDVVKNVALEGKVDHNNVVHVEHTSAHVLDNVREMHAIIFGGRLSDVVLEKFTPGMQYVVRRDFLNARTCDEWTSLHFMVTECHQTSKAMERITTTLFNSTLPFSDMSKWRSPSFCGYQP
mmetsp:Transcript_5365/g.15335  ORF Transcript_5365/g.15335 Transcript_5365/m.15335 type:complete len:148 (-) Transcript_5365:97-540(-)